MCSKKSGSSNKLLEGDKQLKSTKSCCTVMKNFRDVKFIESHSCDSAFFSIKDDNENISHSAFTLFKGFDSDKLNSLSEENIEKLQIVIDDRLKNSRVIELLEVEKAGFFGVTAKVIVDGQNFVEKIEEGIASLKK